MLKAAITSPRDGLYGVTFDHQTYGRTNYTEPSFFIPCASLDHAQAVARAYNGVAFTETRPNPAEKPAGGHAAVAASPLAAHDAAPPVVPAEAIMRDGPQRYRGAPMGVPDYTAPDVTPLDHMHFGIRRVELDAGGYDNVNVVYWGLPRKNLWHARADGNGMGGCIVSRWFRAPSYAHAVEHIRSEFSAATTQRLP